MNIKYLQHKVAQAQAAVEEFGAVAEADLALAQATLEQAQITVSYVEAFAPVMRDLNLWRITITATKGTVEEFVLDEEGEPEVDEEGNPIIVKVDSLELAHATFAASDIRTKPAGKRKTKATGVKIVNGITMTSDIVKNRVLDGIHFVNASDACDHYGYSLAGQSAVVVLAKHGKDWKNAPSLADGVSI